LNQVILKFQTNFDSEPVSSRNRRSTYSCCLNQKRQEEKVKQENTELYLRRIAIYSFLFIQILLTGCDDTENPVSSNNDQKHSHGIEARLLISDPDNYKLTFVDIESDSVASLTTMSSHASIYASSSGRYGFVVESSADKVHVFDGGIYVEDHGDHLHPYKNDAKML